MAEQVIRVMGYTPSDNSVFTMVHFYNIADEVKKVTIDPSQPLNIILDGKASDNKIMLTSHDFPDTYDILVGVYGSWETVEDKVTVELTNLSISSYQLESLDLFTEDLEYQLGPNVVVK